MTNIDIQIAPAMSFLFEEARFKVPYGGRGSAKSHSAARALVVKAMQKQTRWLCCREFQSSIRESVHYLFDSIIQQYGLGGIFDVQQTKILGPNSSEFAFTGLHDKSLDSLKSYEGFDGAWIEEGQSASSRSLQFLRPTIRKDGSEIWITMNPENEEDAAWREHVVDPPKGIKSIIRKVNWYDNPWFNDVLRAEKDADYARDPETAAWIWGGEIRRISDKQVLRGKCETKPFTPGPNWDGPYQGLDFGYGSDPVAFVRCWIWEGCLWIEYEAYTPAGDHTEVEDHPALMDCIPDAREYVTRADCSRPEMVSYLKRNGYKRVTECRKWPGCVEDRVTYLKSFNRIYIHPRCARIAQEGKLWSWKTNKAGDILNVLQEGNDHGWDAVGYALEPHIKGLGFKDANKKQVIPLPVANKW